MLAIIQFAQLLWADIKHGFTRKKKENPRNHAVQPQPILPPSEIRSQLPSPKREMTIQGTPMPILPTDSMLTMRYFVNNNKKLVYNFLLKKMKQAIENNWKAMEMFRVGTTNFVSRINERDYEKCLLDMKDYFVDQQEYEKAALCNSLLDKHHVNVLLDSEKKS